MKIAIHHRKGSFSERWIAYCQQHGIEYKLVNVCRPDIIEQVKGYDAFMWHHHHADYRDALFAKQLIYSLETAGIRCFPNAHTTWHFDDKVGQKYLLESVGAPLVPSYVFYTKKDALEWVRHTDFPKVFKLTSIFHSITGILELLVPLYVYFLSIKDSTLKYPIDEAVNSMFSTVLTLMIFFLKGTE